MVYEFFENYNVLPKWYKSKGNASNQKEMPHTRVLGKDHISKISPFWEHVMVFKKFGDHEDLLETYQNLYFSESF